MRRIPGATYRVPVSEDERAALSPDAFSFSMRLHLPVVPSSRPCQVPRAKHVSDSLAPGTGARSMRQRVDQVVHAELVGFVRLIEWPKPRRGKLPVVRDVGIEIDNDQQALLRIVVDEDPAKDWRPVVVELLHD